MALTRALLDTIAQDYIENKHRLSDMDKFALPVSRFLSRIRINLDRTYNGTPCWEWQGPTHPKTGYCEMVIDGRRGQRKKSSPHRFAYLFFIGDLPEGHEPDHLCRNKACASPFHMEAVTHQENCQRRSDAVDKRFCKRGHERTEENMNSRGGCKICARLQIRQFYLKHPDYMQAQNRKRKGRT